MSRRRKWSDEQLCRAVKSTISIAETIHLLGLRVAGGNYLTIKRRIADLGLNTDHWLGQAYLRGRKHSWKPPRSLESILQPGSRYTSYRLKRRLLEVRLLEGECSECKLVEWLGHPIPLELDHVDGDKENNALANLRLLCPNCHALTPTYRGKNTRYAHIPTLQEIERGIVESGGIPQYAKGNGVTTSTVRRWLKSERLRRLSRVEELCPDYLH